ncbi:MAG: ABC transporter permease [Alphaproteobacteria bacterium]|nr:ABC transporter permease [Alphaproteobacteria bacterium]
MLLFFAIPMAFLFVLSFSSKAVIDGEISTTAYDYMNTFQNYVESAGHNYLVLLWRAIWTSAIATALCLALAYPLAMAVCFAAPRWRPLLLLLLILPFWINLLIRTYAMYSIFRTTGVVNQAFGLVGLGPYEMLNNTYAVIMGLVYVYLPFMVLPLYSTIEKLDRSFLEASLDLGATQAKTFWLVTWPLTLPGVITGIILVYIPCLGTFLTSDILGGPNNWNIGNAIQNQFLESNNWPLGAALSFILMYVTFIALMVRAFLAKRSTGVDA